MPPANPDLLTCALDAPGNFEGTRISASSAALSWSAVSGATAYRLKVYELGYPTPLLVAESVENGLSQSQYGLESGKSYRFTLASICSDNTTSNFIIIIDVGG